MSSEKPSHSISSKVHNPTGLFRIRDLLRQERGKLLPNKNDSVKFDHCFLETRLLYPGTSYTTMNLCPSTREKIQQNHCFSIRRFLRRPHL